MSQPQSRYYETRILACCPNGVLKLMSSLYVKVKIRLGIKFLEMSEALFCEKIRLLP